MKRIIYYLRIILFIIYLVTLFLLIDKVFTIKIFGSLFFIINIIYSILMILTILSKKKDYKNSISYNIVNIGVYLYVMLIYYITSISTKLEVLNNYNYFRNNFILIMILLMGLITFTIAMNEEEK